MTSAFTTDWTGRFSGPAYAVVRPADTAEVRAVMTACSQVGRPVHPQGGNTGLVGGSVPVGFADRTETSSSADTEDRAPVVLLTTRLNWIGDVTGGQLTAGAGATLADVQQAAAAAGLYYGVDIAARDSATIGGTVATNAGGIRVCAFGMTRSQVVGIEAVLADGTVVSHLAGLPKDNTGYDLVGLFTGSEGTLGVVTAVTLRLHSPVGSSTLALVGAKDVAAAQELVATCVPPGSRLLAAEVMNDVGTDIVCEFAGLAWPLANRWPVLLLLEVEGDEILLPDADDLDAILATDATDYARMWRYREHQSEAAQVMAARIDGYVHKLDVSVPLPAQPEFVAELAPLLASIESVKGHYFFGHIADGNLHVELAEPGAHDDAATLAVLELVARHGGSISAEHGVGQAKSAYLHLTRTPAEIAVMRAIKTALDPMNQMAPGVLFPIDS
ncbi:MAG: FAD-binding oxidoreductase [Actinobacteria bacterium]|nr:FAD-binding oxidoreductase [Actinomycetota bacterium]